MVLLSCLPSTWPKVLLAGGVAFIGYAIYFDRKRRLDPCYKQKIRQNRKRKQDALNCNLSSTDFPDPKNAIESEQFFFKSISLGEELLQSGYLIFWRIFITGYLGNIVEGMFHLSNAVVACRQPTELMAIFRQSIPPEHYLLLGKSIPAAKERQKASLERRSGQSGVRIEEVKSDSSTSADADKKLFMLVDEDLE
uniref:Receptor expression-enhancing protein n=1 Tax=Meloidogyne hapla TaxID=6305 RepID=A0A1I8B7E8_MELHA